MKTSQRLCRSRGAGLALSRFHPQNHGTVSTVLKADCSLVSTQMFSSLKPAVTSEDLLGSTHRAGVEEGKHKPEHQLRVCSQDPWAELLQRQACNHCHQTPAACTAQKGRLHGHVLLCSPIYSPGKTPEVPLLRWPWAPCPLC